MLRRFVATACVALPLALPAQTTFTVPGLTSTPARPFGTLKEQAALQQRWLELRMTRVLPALMRKYKVELWVVPMREYNEDPVFSSLVAPTTFAARRRTIYAFYDPCATAKEPATCTTPLEKLAFGGSSQGGVFTAVRSTKSAPGGDASTQGRTAELWGDEQWQVLKQAVVARKPKAIALNTSRTFAFADGLSSGEYEGMREALGPTWAKRFTRVDGLAVELIATRLPEEDAFYGQLQQLVWTLTQKMFSSAVITPGVTKTTDLVWWWRQQVNDLGLGTWFQPSVAVQRKGVASDELEDVVIEKGDVLWCDVGITALRLNTDTQHQGYVLRDGETDAPAGLKLALKNANALQDILLDEVRPGRSGNEILKASLARLKAAGLDGTLYSHPIGMHGHGAGPLIGLWDYQDGVPGRGDFKVIPSMWFSAELQVTTAVPEWNGQRVRVAQEEDFVVAPDGTRRWAKGRQSEFWLVR